MVYYCSYSISYNRSSLEMNLRSPKDKKFNGMSDNKNNRTSNFGMLSVKAGIDNNPAATQADRIAGATMKGKKKKA